MNQCAQRRLPLFLALLACCSAADCVSAAGAADSRRSGSRRPGARAAVTIVHVDIWPMTVDNALLRDMTVVIRGDRIERIAPSGTVVAPRGVRIIDGRGKWLMPSLTDMHAHLENARILRLLTGIHSINSGMFDSSDLLLPYVANGVLQVLNPGAMAEQVGLRDDVEGGLVLGPHMMLGAMVDGTPPLWPEGLSHVAKTPADGRQIVRDAKANGFDFIKTYSRLDADTFDAVLDEARAQGIRVIGHIPGRGLNKPERWLVPGFEMAMHAEEFAFQSPDPDQWQQLVPGYVALARRTGVLLCSTLTLDKRILQQMRDPATLETRPEIRFVNPATRFMWTHSSPYSHADAGQIEFVAKIVRFNDLLAKAFAESGLPVFPGTDSTIPGMVGGFALHDELEALAEAGLTPRQILTADTRQAAEFLRVSGDRGTVEQGKRADLLLLSADPMVDVQNTRDIVAVIASGRVLLRGELDRMMANLSRRYSVAAKPAQQANQEPRVASVTSVRR